MDPAPEQKKSFAQKLQERLAASRFFTFSLLLHVVLLTFLGSYALFKVVQEAPDFESAGGLMESNSSEPPAPEAAPTLTQETFAQDEPTSTAAPTISSAITATTAMPSSFTMAAAVQAPRSLSNNMSKISDPSKIAGKVAGVGNLAGTGMGNRFGNGRGQGRAANGGKDKSEKAVLAGLRWLKDHQSPDGSWSTEHTSAMTGLALLCFFGHGELMESPEFGATVKKGLDWVLAKGTASQGDMGPIKRGNSGVYEHAILTYAMAEYYTMTKDERFEGILRQAVDFIVKGQTNLGGWDYSYNKGTRNDLSVAGWQIQALKAAHLTGLNIAGVDTALDKSMGFLKKFQGNEGGFGYDSPSNRWSLTGVGVLCTYFWKGQKDDTVREGVEYILGKIDDVKYKAKEADLYAWYYHTQACLMYGGAAWTKWNKAFQDEVADNQSSDGSWPVMESKKWFQEKADGAGPFYRTTLCILMLEVFYRYMPIHK